MNETAIWEKAQGLLRDEMSEPSFDTWISPLNVLKLRGDALYIDTTSDFIKKHILMRYSMLITSAVSQAAGRSLRVEFVTPQEAETLFPRTDNTVTASFSLNPKYTFDTFVVGNSNRFARAAALAVAEAPAEAYNPLFIYGGVGLGKTHLMHAIGHRIREDYPDKKLLYISSENFTNELITAIQQNKNAEFRNRFRNVDVLMVDDIQFIAGHNSTQEEFFHTFNTLHTAGKQIVISSDKPPKEIMRLEERLVSRFEWGLVADIQRPDLETRIAILRMIAAMNGSNIPNDVLNLIAERFTENIRELEGALNRVTAMASLTSQPVTRALAEQTLQDFFTTDVEIKPADIITQVAKYFYVTFDDIVGRSRTKKIALARQIAMYLVRELTSMSLNDIGLVFGGKDHTTVMHAYTRINDEMQEKQEIYNYVMELTVQLKQRSSEK